MTHAFILEGLRYNIIDISVSYNNRYILRMIVRFRYLINGTVCVWTTSQVLATINVINRLVHSEIKLIISTGNIFRIYLEKATY